MAVPRRFTTWVSYTSLNLLRIIVILNLALLAEQELAVPVEELQGPLVEFLGEMLFLDIHMKGVRSRARGDSAAVAGSGTGGSSSGEKVRRGTIGAGVGGG